MVCGDTDSIFVCFTGILRSELVGKPRLEETFRFCHILADAVNAQMHAPKKIEVEKVCVTILNCDKKRYAAVLMTSPTAQPKFDVKGMQCVRRNGCALVRNNVRSTLETLVGDRDVDAAIAGVKAIVDNVIEDKLPLDVYVMRQVLRKDKPDCSKPMPPKQLLAIRSRLQGGKTSGAAASTAQLSSVEIDAAIRAGIPVHFETFRFLVASELGWRMRLRDPGTAPKPGDCIEYVVTSNGRGKRISDKAETPQEVQKKLIPVDRQHYLTKFKDVFNKIFSPIFYQQARREQTTAKTAKELNPIVTEKLNSKVWSGLKRPLQTSRDVKRARVHESDIATMWRKASKANGTSQPPQ